MSKTAVRPAASSTFTHDGVDDVQFPHGIVPPVHLMVAREQLSAWVIRQAKQTTHDVGFGWIAQAAAPDSYESLLDAYAVSSRDGTPLPVSDAHCERILFTSAAANHACRFWHDVNHVERRRDFSTVQEIDLALWHLDQLEHVGRGRWSLAWQLFHADTVGQALCAAVLGSFPEDQLAFDVDCVQFGVDDALVLEAERQEQRREAGQQDD
jgi:hypothetical protein